MEPLLPTMLIKNAPWTAAEIASLNKFLAPPEADEEQRLSWLRIRSIRMGASVARLYSGEFPDELADRMAVTSRLAQTTGPISDCCERRSRAWNRMQRTIWTSGLRRR